MELREQNKTGQELRIERRELLDKMHLGLSEDETKRLSELDDLIDQLPANENPENRRLMEQIRKSAKHLNLDPWIYIKDKKPHAWESGNWDGKRSDQVIAEDNNGERHLAVLYSGFMDGSEFEDWYDSGGWMINEPIRYLEIPL